MKKKILLGIYLTGSFIGLMFIFNWFSKIKLSPEEHFNRAVNAYIIEEYSGIIINKFIDREEHNFKKVIINENSSERVILLDIEQGGLFEFLNVGDSIIKTKGNLKVKVIRNNVDTLIEMKFESLPDE